MSQPTSTLSKFVGLTTLGILTGSSLTLSLLTAPALLVLPSTQPASQSLSQLSRSSRSFHTILSNTTLVALLTAWTLAPRGARHPYLLWTALPVFGISAWDLYTTSTSSKSNGGACTANNGKGRGTGQLPWGSGSEDEDGWRDVADAEAANATKEVNGEAVRDGLLDFEREKLVKGAVYGVAFVVGLVGIWGDGY